MARSKIFKRDQDFYESIDKYVLPDTIDIVAFVLRQAYTFFDKSYEKILSDHQLNNSTWITLYVLLITGEAMYPHQLAKFLPIENTSLSPVIDKLENRGLIKRSRSKEDKRTVQIFLTEKGYKLMTEVNPETIELAKFVYGALSPEEARTLIKIARKIRDRVMIWNKRDPAAAEHILERLTTVGTVCNKKRT